MQAGAPSGSGAVGPAIRIRHVLGVAILGLFASWLVPRARAAFSLYTAATAFADYALCMVGPTGPSLLRDNPSEFWRLARRRLVSALPDEHPFERCDKMAALIAEAPASHLAHHAAAAAFTEWGGQDAEGAPSLKIADLGIGTRRLADLAERAWPFVRDGYTNLVKPSSYAAEASHPLEPPRPAVGSGAVPARSISRCVSPGGDAEFLLDVSSDHRWKVVRSIGLDGTRAEVRFAPLEARIFSVSCDANRVVVGVGREGTREVALFSCSRGGSCARTPLPRLSSNGPFVAFPLDVARIDGVTVVAVTMQGIVRVASTRDEGVSWTPLVVAFDPGERGVPPGGTDAPARLLIAGHRLFVAGGAARGAGHWVLASENAGASWHSP